MWLACWVCGTLEVRSGPVVACPQGKALRTCSPNGSMTLGSSLAAELTSVETS